MFGHPPSKKKGREVFPSVYYFPESQMLDCNMYILQDSESEKFCLIDTGNGKSLEGFKAGLANLGLKFSNLQTILITHEHLDHILGLYTILNELGSSEPEIYVSKVTQQILAQGDEEKICPRSLGISAGHFGVSIVPIQNTHALAEGDTFSFGSFSFQVMECPGHSPGSIILYEPTHKLLFPGDVVFPQGSFGRYDFPGGSLSILTKSIQKITELDVDVLCAGHMAPATRNASQQIQLSYRNISSMRF